VTAATRWLDASVGKDAAVIAIGIAGFADAHAASASALTLAHTGTIPGAQLQWMMLVAISTNTVSKVVASLAGGQAYARRMVPALVAIASLAWLATLLAGSAARHV
jgi:uncharacterized membrane protein (DUF4010 family)